MSGGNVPPAWNSARVTKRYGNGDGARTPSASSIERGTLVTLLGPSGCGKTTILRLIAGLEQASDGQILIDGDDVTLLSAAERDVSMVFQSYALFPHMTVLENVCYGLRASGMRKAQAVELAQAKLATGRAGRLRRAPAERIVRRSAAARRGGARHRAGAEGAAVRRAAVQSGRQAAPPRARGDPRAAAEPVAHRGLCDARPAGGAGDLRPHHGDEHGAHRAGRHAARVCTNSRAAISSPTSSAMPTSCR